MSEPVLPVRNDPAKPVPQGLITASGIARGVVLVMLPLLVVSFSVGWISYYQAVLAATALTAGCAVIGVLRFSLFRSPAWMLLFAGGLLTALAESIPVISPTYVIGILVGQALCGSYFALFALIGARANRESDRSFYSWAELLTVGLALAAWFVAALPPAWNENVSLASSYAFTLAPIAFGLAFIPELLLLARMQYSKGPTILVGGFVVSSLGAVATMSLQAAGATAGAALPTSLMKVVGIAMAGVAILEPTVQQLGWGTVPWRRPRSWQRSASVLAAPAVVIGGVALGAASWTDIAWPVLLMFSIALFAVRARLIADEMIARLNRRQTERGAELPPLTTADLISWAQAIVPSEHALAPQWGLAVIAVMPVTDLDTRNHVADNGSPSQEDVIGVDSAVDLDTIRRLREAMRVNERLEPDWSGEWEISHERDHFLVVAAGPMDTENNHAAGLFTAASLASAFNRWLELPFRTPQMAVRVEFAVGYSTRVHPVAADVQPLIQEALSAAKTAAPGTVAAFDPARRKALRRSAQLSALLTDGLLDGSGLTVVYEPIVDLISGRTVGAETLARWNPGGWGPLSPGEFIPLAEKTGAILDLGEWVMVTACTAAVALPGDRLVGVNLSGPEVAHPRLYNRVMTVLDRTGLDPHQLTVEITETVVSEVMEAAEGSLKMLARQGVRLSMDDFGTEASGLARILALPWDSVKLDRSLVVAATTGMGADSPQAALIRAVVRLSDEVHARVVAEGIEDVATLQAIADLGAHLAQGWVFGKGRAELADAWADHRLSGFPFPGRLPKPRDGSASGSIVLSRRTP